MQHNDIDFGRLFICFWNIAVEQKLFISAKVAQMHKSIVLAEPALVVHESFVRQSGLGIVNGLFIFFASECFGCLPDNNRQRKRNSSIRISEIRTPAINSAISSPPLYPQCHFITLRIYVKDKIKKRLDDNSSRRFLVDANGLEPLTLRTSSECSTS